MTSELPNGPNLRAVALCCFVTWMSTVVAVATAVVTGDWLVLMWAGMASILAAGWLIAVRRWQYWMRLTMRWVAAHPRPDGTYRLGSLLEPPDDRDL